MTIDLLLEKIRQTSCWSEIEKIFIHKIFARLNEREKFQVMDALAERENSEEEFFILIKLCEEDYVIWCALAALLVKKALQSGNAEYFEAAIALLKKGSAKSPEKTMHFRAQLFWELGIVYSTYGQVSGELREYASAIGAFEQSSLLGLAHPKLFSDWALGYMVIFQLTHDLTFVKKSVEISQKGLEIEKEFPFAWKNLALALEILFKDHPTKKAFLQAQEVFQNCAERMPFDPHIYYKWGDLLSKFGSISGEADFIKMSFFRYEKALKLGIPKELVLPKLAQVEAIFGGMTENPSYLKRAKNRILSLEEECAQNPIYWKYRGAVYRELALYFDLQQEFQNSIDAYQRGLDLHPKLFSLWAELALVTYEFGLSAQHHREIGAATALFQRAIELKPTNAYIHIEAGITHVKLGTLEERPEEVQKGLDLLDKGLQILGSEHSPEEIPPLWYFHIGCAYGVLGDLTGEETHLNSAIVILGQLLDIHSDFDLLVHSELASILMTLGEVLDQVEPYQEACKHFLIYLQKEPEDEEAWFDWGSALVQIAHYYSEQVAPGYQGDLLLEAENKFHQAAALGSIWAYYPLSCLSVDLGDFKKAMMFLEKAASFDALPPPDALMDHASFDLFRMTPEFHSFIEKYRQKSGVE